MLKNFKTLYYNKQTLTAPLPWTGRVSSKKSGPKSAPPPSLRLYSVSVYVTHVKMLMMYIRLTLYKFVMKLIFEYICLPKKFYIFR